uniref:Uncharacterized protein n=1 Tax=Cucumis melo TaxID=3656 RepID=A0A9I9CQ67_CUCME
MDASKTPPVSVLTANAMQGSVNKSSIGSLRRGPCFFISALSSISTVPTCFSRTSSGGREDSGFGCCSYASSDFIFITFLGRMDKSTQRCSFSPEAGLVLILGGSTVLFVLCFTSGSSGHRDAANVVVLATCLSNSSHATERARRPVLTSSTGSAWSPASRFEARRGKFMSLIFLCLFRLSLFVAPFSIGHLCWMNLSVVDTISEISFFPSDCLRPFASVGIEQCALALIP